MNPNAIYRVEVIHSTRGLYDGFLYRYTGTEGSFEIIQSNREDHPVGNKHYWMATKVLEVPKQ